MKYEREITADEEKILSHYLIDIKQWIDLAIQGKINANLKNAVREYREVLKKEGAVTIPLNDTDAFTQFTQRPDYKNRQERDALITPIVEDEPI